MNFSNLTDLFNSPVPFMENGVDIFTFEKTFNLAKNRSMIFEKSGIRKGDRVIVICNSDPSTIFDILGLWLLGVTPVLVSKKEPKEEIEKIKIDLNDYHTDSDHPNIIFFTSGSQGKPKAVLHSLENLISSAQASVDFYGIDSKDRYLVTLPLNHVGGFMIFIRSILSKCRCIFPQTGISFANYHPTILSLVPTQLLRLKDEDFLKKTKAILVGGDAILGNLIPKIKELPISLTYGMTESAAQVAASRPYTQEMKILPGREIKISNNGIILIRGGMGKYLNADNVFDNDGFFQTSDQGAISDNHLKVLGRSDKIFIRGGENISPGEIERACLNIEDISFSRVIPVNDEIYGSVPILFYQSKRKITDFEFTQQLSTHLPPFKIPKQFIKVPESTELKWNEKELLRFYETP